MKLHFPDRQSIQNEYHYTTENTRGLKITLENEALLKIYLDEVT